ncbi:restriction endonuclease subunit S [Alistipes dispar]|uniref:restriction endonuclease subunit S n=1 Tax=Alistipes dispar TaxID=2585119 RepID=UPI00248BBDEE|nr:restriction endonuclease subunit S [Alistipes dispar]
MRLKDVAFVNLRTLDESTKGDYKFRYIDISSVSADNGIILGDEITFQEAPSRARRIVKKDDVLVSTVRTYLRAIANIDWDAKDIIASTGFAVYTPNNKIIPRFLAYSIKSTKAINQICSNSKGVSYPAIQAQVLSSIEIPYWDLKRQEAIAAYLDKECEKIGRKIELLERKADAYSRLRRSLINRAVTRGLDPNVSLKPSGNNWIGDIPQHWGYERVEKYFHNNTSYNKDFQYKHAFKFFKGTIIHKDETFEEDEYQDTYEKYTIVEPNDIIINGLNLNYDLKSMRVGKVTENGIITSAYIVLRPYNNVCSDFFNYLFKAFDYRKFFHGMGKGIRLTLSFNELRYFEIPVPPIEEQKEIAAYLDEKCAKIDAILEKINTEVERLKEMKRSLINEVVTGQRAIDTESHS